MLLLDEFAFLVVDRHLFSEGVGVLVALFLLSFLEALLFALVVAANALVAAVGEL